MPLHPFSPLHGRLETIQIDFPSLRGNILGDPSTRAISVYLPSDYDASDNAYPLFVALAGFTGSGLRLPAWRAFDETLPQRIDRLVTEGRMGPVILAMPDGFTSLGGNQYVSSPVFGDWEQVIVEALPFALEARYRVLPGPAHRAVFGKSSGGYGAALQALRYGHRWAGVAVHSGDMGFETVYGRELPPALDALARYPDGIAGFMADLRGGKKVSGSMFHVLMTLAMAASYDPDPSQPFGIRLPVDPETAELDAIAWSRWRTWDPVVMAEDPENLARLRCLRCLYVDVGTRDQYYIHYGTRAFRRRLLAAHIPHVYEEFDDDHSSIDYRLDASLPLLYAATVGGT